MAFNFTPTESRDCPHCGSEGERTAILGPADCYRCQDTDCPVRGFWSVADVTTRRDANG